MFSGQSLLDQALEKMLSMVQSWLSQIAEQHSGFSYDLSMVKNTLRNSVFEGKELAHNIFPGVSATPITSDLGEDNDAKLVSLKLIKVEPGAIIPLHRHGGFEYYQLLPGSELLDTRDAYNEKRPCISGCGDSHAVMNISSKCSYALIALPTEKKLTFLREAEALKVLEEGYLKIKHEDTDKPHHLFTRLLYANSLYENNSQNEAQCILSEVDLDQINHPSLLSFAQDIKSKVEASEHTSFKAVKI